MAKKIIEIIDVNTDPVIREHKKNYCPWCDKKNEDCKCERK